MATALGDQGDPLVDGDGLGDDQVLLAVGAVVGDPEERIGAVVDVHGALADLGEVAERHRPERVRPHEVVEVVDWSPTP